LTQTLFISDLHLSRDRAAVNKLFFDFLDQGTRDTDCLYILGDLFDYWIGNDAAQTLGQTEVLEALHGLTHRGVPVRVMRGNRDFLLDREFARVTGCELLPDPAVVQIYGRPALLTHGDRLCTDDHKHQQFRDMVDDPEWQHWFLAKPVSERISLATDARSRSEFNKSITAMDIMDVNPGAVVRALQEHGVDLMIHGHTHRPAFHNLTIEHVPARRIVLGDWHHEASVLRWRPPDDLAFAGDPGGDNRR
jgi:UDP-2,3-diacylglucosamine hydrolase